MRISDWSSDVCSSDLLTIYEAYVKAQPLRRGARQLARKVESGHTATDDQDVFARAHRFNPSDLAGSNDRRRALQCMCAPPLIRSEEHTSELQSLMRISYAVFCLKKKKQIK